VSHRRCKAPFAASRAEAPPVAKAGEEEDVSRSVIASVMLAAFVFGGHAVTAQEAASPAAAVPKAVLKLLDERWKGWRLATVDNVGACAATLNGRSPSFVRADLNGDGTEDVALQIATDDGIRIIAAISRMNDDVELIEVDQVSGAPEVLGFAQRGKKFSPDDLAQFDYFGVDTLTTSRCEKTTTAYFWMGASFRKRLIVV
jgi:hypothetical protein